MYVYIIILRTGENIIMVAHQVYESLKDAQHYVETQPDKPRKRSEYQYETKKYVYEIIEARLFRRRN